MPWTIEVDSVENWCPSRAMKIPRFHAALCDPPYLIDFMNKEWDARRKRESLSEMFQLWGEAILQVLHPGAIVLMFGGTRTWHHLAVGMENAGFELWDTIMWLYGQGFPKAQQIESEGWEEHKTKALKPAWEPILCFQAPTGGRTIRQCAEMFGTGSLWIDGGRIPVDLNVDDPRLGGGGTWRTKSMAKNAYGEYAGDEIGSSLLGRFPANLVLTCTCEETEIVELETSEVNATRDGEASAQERYQDRGGTSFCLTQGERRVDRQIVRHTDPECPAYLLDQQTGILTSGANPESRNSDITRGIYGKFTGRECFPVRGADSGGASRFFYCAKVDRRERNAGLDGVDKQPLLWSAGQKNASSFQSEGTEQASENNHPTLKPVDLCRWLATLLLPPPRSESGVYLCRLLGLGPR